MDKKYTNLIRIKTFGSEGDELKETGNYFEKAYKAGMVTNTFAREFGTTIFVFEKARVDINERIKKEIRHKKY